MLELLFRHRAKVCASDVTGETALHLIQDDFDLDEIRMLLRHGADVNAQDKEGTTLLHKVMKLNPGYIRQGIVDFLA
jgi:ankyrin repeat protein